ncbi:exported hypothetical protein [Paraburkholderia ribeironis]|uniref:Uncharacterized protein n=1 Tax=Paraburkholderia ribeironis TaxID=1247936 RepID=A0A1N7SNS7_9BURK|nr:exported hypothetical protein [Paraburkholderia ribeironis]
MVVEPFMLDAEAVVALAAFVAFTALMACAAFAPLATDASAADAAAFAAGDDATRADAAEDSDGAANDTAADRAQTAAVSERHNDTTGFINRSACLTSAVHPSGGHCAHSVCRMSMRNWETDCQVSAPRFPALYIGRSGEILRDEARRRECPIYGTEPARHASGSLRFRRQSSRHICPVWRGAKIA